MTPWYEREVVLTEEGSRRLRIMLEGTPEERAELKKQQDEEHRAWEHEIVAVKAYYIWEKAGRPHGRDVEFWLEAERVWNKECDDYEPCICNGIAY